MNQPKRIWKTAVVAIAVTLVFAIFAFNFEDWANGLSSEFVVYGQTSTGGTGGGTGTSGTSGTSLTKILPQVAVGSFDANITKYISVIQVTNTGTAAISVTADFYNQSGTASTLSFKTNVALPATFPGALPATSLAAGNTLVLTADTATTGTVNWGKITTTGAATVSAYFEFRDVATNFLYTRVGLAGSSATLKKFAIPWVRNGSTGLDVGFALVNSGLMAANITVTAKDVGGVTVGTPRVYAALPGAQTASFANQFLSLPTAPTGTTYGYLLFDSTDATFSAVALAFEAGALSSFPVDHAFRQIRTHPRVIDDLPDAEFLFQPVLVLRCIHGVHDSLSVIEEHFRIGTHDKIVWLEPRGRLGLQAPDLGERKYGVEQLNALGRVEPLQDALLVLGGRVADPHAHEEKIRQRSAAGNGNREAGRRVGGFSETVREVPGRRRRPSCRPPVSRPPGTFRHGEPTGSPRSGAPCPWTARGSRAASRRSARPTSHDRKTSTLLRSPAGGAMTAQTPYRRMVSETLPGGGDSVHWNR